VRSLAHAPLNDAVAAWDWRGRCGDDGGGGVAAFSTLTGDLSHCFRVAHGRQPRSFTADALAFSWGAGGRAPDLRRRALAVAEQAVGVEREDQGARRDSAPPPLLLAAVVRRSGPGPWPAPRASSLSSPRWRRGRKRRRGDARRRGTRARGRREATLAGCHRIRPFLRAVGGHGLRLLLRTTGGRARPPDPRATPAAQAAPPAPFAPLPFPRASIFCHLRRSSPNERANRAGVGETFPI
jgi:hypothetical protein